MASTASADVVRVRILNEELALRTDGDPEAVERLAADLDARLRRAMAERNLSAQPTKAVLLVALNLLEEMSRLKASHEAYVSSAAAAAAAMMRRIEQTLGG